MGRVVGIDYGAKRVGIAVTDPLKIIATALTTVENKKTIEFLKAYVIAEPVEKFLVGYPTDLRGNPTHATPYVEKFIIELGNGFCFEARQKRILIGDEYFFIDMVFYHRILKCHVIVELKVDEFNHVHASQLKTYLNFYNKNFRTKGDNPPIGILMVTNKNKALVEYATSGISEKVFVSKYAVALPSKKQLENFIKNELKIL
mgnify:CR=1 FL=1